MWGWAGRTQRGASAGRARLVRDLVRLLCRPVGLCWRRVLVALVLVPAAAESGFRGRATAAVIGYAAANSL